ncbi:DUF4245 domain-containing protein [Agilicoccus flavus]|uniref:DUF4245 domain-containing protein n=1 Tax=Agilicoccus flavus TaxID=2775968 RepID=UPI001CF6134B|nr:DUF4245 domain-containing protein [Agilicoccus flavus]
MPDTDPQPAATPTPPSGSTNGGTRAATPAASGSGTGAPARKRRGGGMRSLVLSMLVLLAFVLAWSALTPRPAGRSLPPVDAASSARTVAAQTGWPLRFAATPPAGWRPTSVSYGPVPAGPTVWRVGYHDGEDRRYLSVQQTRSAPGAALDGWVSAQTYGGRDTGTVSAGGLTWSRRLAEGDPTRRSLVARDEATQMTYVLVGAAEEEDLRAFAAALTPYRAG